MKTTRRLGLSVLVFSLLLAVANCSGGGGSSLAIPTSPKSNEPPTQQAINAASKGDVKTLKAVVDADPSLMELRGIDGMTLLHCAASVGANDCVKYLLEKGADPMVEDDNSNTSIAAALSNNHKDTAKILEDAAKQRGGNTTG